MEPFVDVVERIGFPIAVAGYLLIRGDKLMREMRDEMRELVKAIKNGLPRPS